MPAVDLKSLFLKLNHTCQAAFNNALHFRLQRTHHSLEVEHWLMMLLEQSNTDLEAVFRQKEISLERVKTDLTRVLDKFKTGLDRPNAPISGNVQDLLKNAWMVASVNFSVPRVRSGHVMCALLDYDEFGSPLPAELRKHFVGLQADQLRTELPLLTQSTAEAESEAQAVALDAAGKPAVPSAAGTQALDQLTIDLTERARAGKIDPVLGRDAEIRQVVDILTRRRQNNPILTGEAGVGKTAAVEGFALRVAAGDVPPLLKDVVVRTLDLGLLQAGASMKGEFENRLKSVIEEVKASPQPIILFIDEAHTMIGAGGQAGQSDAANLLKPALARGELRTIAATTWAEYKKYFERDAALARRFQVVKIEEPSEGSAVEMMRGLVATLEAHHKVRILDEAVVDAVRLSHRYISGRQLPDKSVSLLDTACARVAMSQSATPADIEDTRRRIEQIDVELGILRRETATGGAHEQKIAEREEERADAQARLDTLEQQWQREKELTGEVREIRGKLEAAHGGPAAAKPLDGGSPEMAAAPAGDAVTEQQVTEWHATLKTLSQELAQIQGESPLLHPVVDGQAVAGVVAAWTGIPVGRMVSNEIQAVLNLKEKMEERIVGQPHALDAIAQAMRTSRAKLTDPRKPIGVFLMVGTSGVGKTETALTLAEILYGGEQNVTVINMSEYKEEHKVSLLMGSPPGYVGYGEGGVLTEAVRRRPYSVVLLDEMEKAHPGVQDLFYQVFDKGMLRDGEGRDIDFKNTVIIMTSNAGTDTIASICEDPETMPDAEGLAEALRPELMQTFKPAFLGRVTLVPYFPLGDDVMKGICRLQLGRVGRRVEENYRCSFDYAPELVDHIVDRCKETATGARNIEHILNRTLLPELAAHFLERMAAEQGFERVQVSIDDAGVFQYLID